MYIFICTYKYIIYILYILYYIILYYIILYYIILYIYNRSSISCHGWGKRHFLAHASNDNKPFMFLMNMCMNVCIVRSCNHYALVIIVQNYFCVSHNKYNMHTHIAHLIIFMHTFFQLGCANCSEVTVFLNLHSITTM